MTEPITSKEKMSKLSSFLSQNEWYDNHRLSTILSCQRKAFFHLEFRGGLEAGVGDGARVGSAIHAGLATFHGLTKSHPEMPFADRKERALRSTLEEYEKRMGEISKLADVPERKLESKHRPANLVAILDDYFKFASLEDSAYRVVETEVAAVAPIAYNPETDPYPFETFYYAIRADGVWERRATGELFVVEHKTTGWSVDREITRRAIDRQARGYTYVLRQWSPRIKGTLINCLLVAAQKRECRREYFPRSAEEIRSWRAQTIKIVEDWRALRSVRFDVWSDEANGLVETYWEPGRDGQDSNKKDTLAAQLDRYVQNDNHCTAYGKCPYFDGCWYGPQTLSHLQTNTWNPFEISADAGTAT